MYSILNAGSLSSKCSNTTCFAFLPLGTFIPACLRAEVAPINSGLISNNSNTSHDTIPLNLVSVDNVLPKWMSRKKTVLIELYSRDKLADIERAIDGPLFTACCDELLVYTSGTLNVPICA